MDPMFHFEEKKSPLLGIKRERKTNKYTVDPLLSLTKNLDKNFNPKPSTQEIKMNSPLGSFLFGSVPKVEIAGSSNSSSSSSLVNLSNSLIDKVEEKKEEEEKEDVNPILENNWFTKYNELSSEEREWLYQQVIKYEMDNPEEEKKIIQEKMQELTIQEIYRATNSIRPSGLPGKTGASSRKERKLFMILHEIKKNKTSIGLFLEEKPEEVNEVKKHKRELSGLYESEMVKKSQILNPRKKSRASYQFDYEEEKEEEKEEVEEEEEEEKQSTVKSSKKYKKAKTIIKSETVKSEQEGPHVYTIKCLNPLEPSIMIISKVPLDSNQIVGYYKI